MRYYFDTEQIDKALECYQKSYQIASEVFGEAHVHTANAILNIGIIHYEKKDFPTAAQHYEKALNTFISLMGNAYFQVPEVTKMLYDTYKNMNDPRAEIYLAKYQELTQPATE